MFSPKIRKVDVLLHRRSVTFTDEYRAIYTYSIGICLRR